MFRYVLLLGVLPLMLLGCAGDVPSGRVTELIRPESIRLIEAPEGTVYAYPTWISGLQKIVFRNDPCICPLRTRLFAVAANGLKPTRLALPADPDCETTYQVFGRPLPDGSLAYVEQCGGKMRNGRREPEEATTLKRFDPRSQVTERLRSFYLPFQTRWLDISGDGHILVNDGGGLYERLYRLGERGLEPIDLPFARVGFPSWAPDGRRFAIDAVPTTASQGVDRVGLNRGLFIVTPTGAPRMLVEGIKEASPSLWSPDGHSLIVGLVLDGDDSGLYRVNVASRKKELLLRGDQFGGATWAGPNRLVVAVGVRSQTRTEVPGDVGLLVIDMSRIASA